MKTYKVGILATHPIQYYVPWYRELAKYPELNLEVFYCHQQTANDQSKAGFNISFDWDIPLLDGYQYRFLNNQSSSPNVYDFQGCDTPEIKTIIQQGNFDAFIVQGWYVKSFWQAIRTCWKTKTPLLVRGDSHLLTQRSKLKRAIKYPFYRWFIPKFDAYLVVGQRNREYYQYYGANEEKMFFAPHAVDNNYFLEQAKQLKAQRNSIRQTWGIPMDAIVFLFAGKLISIKRPFDFVEALLAAYQENKHVHGLIVGDGPLGQDLQDKVRSLSAPISFTGFLNQSQMPTAYVASDVVAVTSTSETWGLTVNEAMACGLPAIVSDRVGCASDLILSERTGIVFPLGDVEALSKAMLHFAATSEDIIKYGIQAHQHIQLYSIPKVAKATLAAISKVAGSNGR